MVQGQLGPATTTYRNVLDGLITAKVAERKDNQRAIGLLERFDGLHALVAGHPFLRAAEWAVRRDMEDDAEINALTAQLLAQAGTWQAPVDES
jgi:hypothetical protein